MGTVTEHSEPFDDFIERLAREQRFDNARQMYEYIDRAYANRDLGTDAYDGENEPQKRELTARERDILTRVILDILFRLRDTLDLNSLMFRRHPRVAAMGMVDSGIRLSPSDVRLLGELFVVLNPRKD